MRIVTCFLFLPVLVAGAYAQAPTAPGPVQIRTLTIISSSLTEADRQQMIHALQGGTFVPEELAERVRQYLRDAGYFNARADAPEISAVQRTPASPSAEVRIQVDPGALYTIGNITFENAKAFSPEELRRQFPSRPGELFSATEISKGLNNLRDLYLQKGYANFGVIPKPRIDESRHIVSFIIDCDESRTVSFGHPRLEGTEAIAGAGKSLLISWKEMQGKLYRPEEMKNMADSKHVELTTGGRGTGAH